MFNPSRWLPLVFAVIGLYLPCAHAQSTDAALVTGLSGKATQTSGKSRTALETMLKLREGDGVELGAGSSLTVVYLTTGLVETWPGPARFVVGKSRTETKELGTPSTRTLPAAMLERIARAPDVVADIRNRSGLVTVRAFDPKTTEKIKAARAMYDADKTAAASGEATPDIFMFVELYQAGRYRDAQGVLAKLLAQNPDDQAIRQLSDEMSGKLRP
jgi:hypothetical protein